jgi:hypothetical protein
MFRHLRQNLNYKFNITKRKENDIEINTFFDCFFHCLLFVQASSLSCTVLKVRKEEIW